MHFAPQAFAPLRRLAPPLPLAPPHALIATRATHPASTCARQLRHPRARRHDVRRRRPRALLHRRRHCRPVDFHRIHAVQRRRGEVPCRGSNPGERPAAHPREIHTLTRPNLEPLRGQLERDGQHRRDRGAGERQDYHPPRLPRRTRGVCGHRRAYQRPGAGAGAHAAGLKCRTRCAPCAAALCTL